MTKPLELRDSDDARRFLLHGLLRQSVRPPHVASLPRVLEWCLEIAGEGIPLPPPGFVADVGHLAFHDGEPGEAVPETNVEILPSTLLRQYEDQVLGKLYADASFERGVDGLGRFPAPRDRAKGLAFLLQQLGRRAGCRGVLLSPAVVKDLRRSSPKDVLAEARATWAEPGPLRVTHHGEESTLLEFLYRDLVTSVRNVGEVLGVEDVFELEHGTALAEFGQRIALRQTLRAAADFEAALPKQPVTPRARRHDVATRVHDEDVYPIGGFSSLSNRGTVESLLHSQLAFMEPADAERPDMFDVKFLRDELLYYSRDENQFFRRRRTYVFVLDADLVRTRVKDAGLPFQRVVLLLGLLYAAVRTLTEWLGDDALVFEFAFPREAERSTPPLADERDLLAMLFREQVENGTVRLLDLDADELPGHATRHSRRSLCHVVRVATEDRVVELDGVLTTRLVVAGPRPAFAFDDDPPETPEGEAFAAWSATLEHLLAGWV